MNSIKLNDISLQLCKPSAVNALYHKSDQALPSLDILHKIISLLKSVIFPGYFGNENLSPDTLHYHMTAHLDNVHQLLTSQLIAGLCFDCKKSRCLGCEKEGREAANQFMLNLPELRDMLSGDVLAAYEGDPAAKSPGETIFCYPSITAMFHHRIAHAIYKLDMPLIPRIIAEMSHSSTGIDIHPGAQIGKNFFIDHGTGVVIGETCIIGNGCRIYQGVTLGALSFPKNENGTLIKGVPRHPILEDNVIVYAGATILGRVTIGSGAVIGGNVWITNNVSPGARIAQEHNANN